MGIKGSPTSWSVRTSGISIYGHKGEPYILASEDMRVRWSMALTSVGIKLSGHKGLMGTYIFKFKDFARIFVYDFPTIT